MLRQHVLALAILFTLPLLADEVLDNASVIRMVRGGLGIEVIVLKIERSPSRFDVTTDALLDLKAAGVPEPIMRAMLLRTPASVSPRPAEPAGSTPPAPSLPGLGSREQTSPPPHQSPMPNPLPPIQGSMAPRCASVSYYTPGTNGWSWLPAEVCVSMQAFSIDDQDIPLKSIIAACSSDSLLSQHRARGSGESQTVWTLTRSGPGKASSIR